MKGDFDSAAFSMGDACVTICAVSLDVMVLATKTRPKKLQLLGSDGLQHIFLLKGREDLRLDERLMQVRDSFIFVSQGRPQRY